MSDDGLNVQVITLNALIDRTDKRFDGDEVYAVVYFLKVFDGFRIPLKKRWLNFPYR